MTRFAFAPIARLPDGNVRLNIAHADAKEWTGDEVLYMPRTHTARLPDDSPFASIVTVFPLEELDAMRLAAADAETMPGVLISAAHAQEFVIDQNDVTFSAMPRSCVLNKCDTGFGNLAILMCGECFIVVEAHTAGAGRVEAHGTRQALEEAQFLLLSRLAAAFSANN